MSVEFSGKYLDWRFTCLAINLTYLSRPYIERAGFLLTHSLVSSVFRWKWLVTKNSQIKKSNAVYLDLQIIRMLLLWEERQKHWKSYDFYFRHFPSPPIFPPTFTRFFLPSSILFSLSIEIQSSHIPIHLVVNCWPYYSTSLFTIFRKIKLIL